MKYKLDTDGAKLTSEGARETHKQPLSSYDWMHGIPESLHEENNLVEVQFKNTRKGYYINSEGLELHKGDWVTVEASPGHDIGRVTLTGRLVPHAMKLHHFNTERNEIRRIYRLAKPYDLERMYEAKSREHDTMIETRQIAAKLGLEMKIGDVEYQADGSKAIFYYIADGRVDFRQLIRVLADTFHIRVEMKQIGARQEAGRIGGIGPCGRQLCCSAWMTNFMSVNTSAARIQDLSMNPQKLTGQCAKLKCCMNFEVDSYLDAQKKMPSPEIVLHTKKGDFYHFKSDIFHRQITYSTEKNAPVNLVTIPVKRVFDIINMNKRNELPETIGIENPEQKTGKKPVDILDENSLTRFDAEMDGKRSSRNGKRKRNNGNQPPVSEGQKTTNNGNKPNNGGRQLRNDGENTAPVHQGNERRRNNAPNRHPQPGNGEGRSMHGTANNMPRSARPYNNGNRERNNRNPQPPKNKKEQ